MMVSCVLAFALPSTKQNDARFVGCDGTIKRGFYCQPLREALR